MTHVKNKQLWILFQVEAAFKRFDQTGNDKLNLKEFSDMMSKRSDSKANASDMEFI